MEEKKVIRKSIQGKGDVDYDFKHDILFFKTKDRKYAKSIELLDNIVVDVDKEGFLVGVQIFDASEFLNLDKKCYYQFQNGDLMQMFMMVTK